MTSENGTGRFGNSKAEIQTMREKIAEKKRAMAATRLEFNSVVRVMPTLAGSTSDDGWMKEIRERVFLGLRLGPRRDRNGGNGGGKGDENLA